MKKQAEIGDLFLVIGKSHIEKVEVVSIQGNTLKLSNNILLDLKSKQPLNSKMIVEAFDEDKYELLLSKQSLSKLSYEVQQLILSGQVPDENVVKVKNRLTKIIKLIKGND